MDLPMSTSTYCKFATTCTYNQKATGSKLVANVETIL